MIDHYNSILGDGSMQALDHFHLTYNIWVGGKVKECGVHRDNVRNERYKYVNTIINNKFDGHQNYGHYLRVSQPNLSKIPPIICQDLLRCGRYQGFFLTGGVFHIYEDAQ